TYGTFAIDSAGAWTYTASSAHNEFAAGSTYSDTFSVASADGTLTAVTINILGTNDAAVLSSVAANAAYTELGTATTPSAGATVSDVDNISLTSATVSITAGLFSGDTLAATVTGTGITASYSSGTGVLSLSGSDTLAHYQQVLDGVIFSS